VTNPHSDIVAGVERKPDTVRSVDRAARILKALGAGTPRLGVTELADRVDLPKATIHGLLRALEQQEFVERDAETGKYRLGPALLQLGNAFLDTHELRSRALLWAGSLASRTGEAVRVGVLNGGSVLIVHHVFRPDDSVQILEVGASIPWHACALGKASVAYAEEARRRTLLGSPLGALTGRTITDAENLREVLAAVTRHGYAVEDQEAVVGESEIAAPVFDHHGVIAGAIGLVGPVERLTPDGRAQEAFVSAVKETARGLSRDMGAGRLAARGR
jgi:DNA-binding IclR family transcriptional regulator